MRRKWLGSITTMLFAAGAAWAQAPVPVSPETPPAGQAVEQVAASADGAPTPVVQVPPPVAPAASPALTPAMPAKPNCDTAPVLPASTFSPTRHSEYASGPDADVWFNAEYILWWIKNERIPTLVGTSPTADVQTGSLKDITPIYGDTTVHYHEQSGVRLSAGGWINESHTIGLDASFFQLERKASGTTISSGGDPVIGPVFFDPVALQNTLVLASLPAFASGPFTASQRSATIGIESSNQFWGADANARINVGAVFFMDHLDILLGYRQMYFSEALDMNTVSTALPGNPGPNIFISDHFGTRNQFYGGQFGFASHGSYGRWSFDGVFKFAMGDVHEVLNIDGSTTISEHFLSGIRQTTTPGGVFTQPTNIGHFNKDQFGVLPELTLTAGYQLTQHARATIGYNILYLSQVLRAGDQFDLVDGRQVQSLSTFTANSGATQPQPRFFSDRFYAQGLNLGLEFSY